MRTDGTLHVKGCKQGEIQFLDKRTDKAQVHVLSCAFATKKRSLKSGRIIIHSHLVSRKHNLPSEMKFKPVERLCALTT